MPGSSPITQHRLTSQYSGSKDNKVGDVSQLPGIEFWQGLRTAAQVASPVVWNMMSKVPGIGAINDLLAGLSLGSGSGGLSEQGQLLLQQERIQRESQRFTMATNISKARHDALMSAVRNVRP